MNQNRYFFLLSELLTDRYQLTDAAEDLRNYIESELNNKGFVEEIYLNALNWTEELIEES